MGGNFGFGKSILFPGGKPELSHEKSKLHPNCKNYFRKTKIIVHKIKKAHRANRDVLSYLPYLRFFDPTLGGLRETRMGAK